MKKSLFDKEEQIPRVTVFHDESGNYGPDRWVFTGLFWIFDWAKKELTNNLKKLREKENYQGKIHYNEFPKNFGGEFGKKPRVAKNWYNEWEANWARKTFFNVLAVHRKSPFYDDSSFKQKFHEYNRFTAMALKSGLAWFFHKNEKIILRICSDEKSRRPKGLLGDGVQTDNFERYLAYKVKQDTWNYKGPSVFLQEIECLSCGKKGPYLNHQELLQLTDILLGSVGTAIFPKSKAPTKLWFGNQMVKLIEDIREKSWKQKKGLFRKFSVSYFPNPLGGIYNNGPILIRENENQKKLF